MNEKKITNEYIIRNLWTKEDIASALIEHRDMDDYDYDYDGNLYVCGTYDVYTTSDNENFQDYEDAFEHQMWWLSQEVELLQDIKM